MFLFSLLQSTQLFINTDVQIRACAFVHELHFSTSKNCIYYVFSANTDYQNNYSTVVRMICVINLTMIFQRGIIQSNVHNLVSRYVTSIKIFSWVDVALNMESDSGSKLPVLQTATALAVSFVICLSATYLTKLFGIQGGTLPSITAIVVVLATALPMYFGYLAPAGDTIAVVLMQVSVISQAYLIYIMQNCYLQGVIMLA